MAGNRIDIAAWAASLMQRGTEEAAAQGLRRVAYFCSYIPEELLSVPGLYAYRMRAPNDISTEIADTYLGAFNCSYTRCLLEFLLAEDQERADGYVFAASCDHLRRMYDNFVYARQPAFHRILDLPHKSHTDAVAWYKRELAALRDALVVHFGVAAGTAELKRTIRECNHTRRMIAALDELRRRPAPPLSGADMQRILNVSSSLPKSIVNPALARLLAGLQDGEPVGPHRARVLLLGSNLDDPEYIAIIESVGALVVADLHCCGAHHYIHPVAEGSDPLLQIAARYLEKLPCPRMFAAYAQRFAAVVEAARRFDCHGVIVQTMKFCDCWGIEGNVFVNNLRQRGLRVLRLDREYTLGAVGQLRTRVQAFLESLAC